MMKAVVLVAACIVGVSAAALRGRGAAADTLNFVSIGDWGKVGTDQTNVAAAMGNTAAQVNAQFVLALGDNFYENGVSSVSDPQWKTTWENVYTADSLTSVPWYVILGNHDYHQCPECQVQFQNGTQWHMPNNWYTKTFDTPDGASVQIVFIDTVNLAGDTTMNKMKDLQSEGRLSDDVVARWSDYMSSGRQSADASKQLAWIEAQLSASTADWLIVCGHYPVYSAAEHGDTAELIADVLPMLKKYKVDTYMDGHDHVLEHMQSDGIDFYVSGNGAKEGTMEGKTPQLVWGVMDPGFTVHKINSTMFETSFVDHTGATIYSHTQQARRNVQH